MKPVLQTRFGAEGNCTQACIASILEISIEGIPHVTAEEDRNGWIILERWLEREHALALVHFPKGFMRGVQPIGFHLIGGTSPRGLPHAVVGYEGRIVHDPHPDGGGLVEIEGALGVKILSLVKDGE